MRPYAACVLLAATATAEAATFPGGPPCDTTLQACIDGAPVGDTVQIARDGPIDESVTVRRSLTLTSAPGFAPVIGTGALHRILAIEDAGEGGGGVDVTLANLTLSNTEIKVKLDDDTGHRVAIRGCRVSHGSGGNTGSGIAVDMSVPSSVEVRNTTVSSPGDGIRLSASLAAGSASLTAVANRVSTFNPFDSHDGIAVDFAGAGEVTAYLYSNVVHGVAGCNCRTAAGIDVSSAGAVTAAVNIINNTVDDIRVSSNGIQIRKPRDSAHLTANVFNNVVTRATKAGFSIQSPHTDQLQLSNGFNDSFGNAVADFFGGYTPGPMTLGVDPLYVDAGAANYHLAAASPLVDAGEDDPVGGLPDADADEQPRRVRRVDIGAYEFAGSPAVTTTTTTLPDAGCRRVATYDAIRCRLDGLAAPLAVRQGRFATALRGSLRAARKETARAEMLAAHGRRKATRVRLARALRSVARYARRLGSPQGRRFAGPSADGLLGLAAAIVADLRALRLSV